MIYKMYQWHNLMKDKNDLPLLGGSEVLTATYIYDDEWCYEICLYLTEPKYISKYDWAGSGFYRYSDGHGGFVKIDVDGWKYIEGMYD